MSSCCSIDTDAKPQPCPECDQTGPVVGFEPVRPHRCDVVEESWQHCATAGCRVVYHLGDQTVTEAQVRTQVAHKAVNKPTPVCFCFSHTTDDLATDLQANAGTSTIKAAIKIAVADGFCACAHLNPSQQCCLPDVHSALKKITSSS